MAQRLSFDERARVEAMPAAGVSVAGTARCLGRHRSTVYRELRRGRRGGVYDAEAAQAAAAVGAARPKIPVLAADPELAASVREGLKEGWSPHAIRAGLRAEGRTVSAETIYRAAYGHSGSSGPASASTETPRANSIAGGETSGTRPLTHERCVGSSRAASGQTRLCSRRARPGSAVIVEQCSYESLRWRSCAGDAVVARAGTAAGGSPARSQWAVRAAE